jgi:hypothetical protein
VFKPEVTFVATNFRIFFRVIPAAPTSHFVGQFRLVWCPIRNIVRHAATALHAAHVIAEHHRIAESGKSIAF